MICFFVLVTENALCYNIEREIKNFTIVIPVPADAGEWELVRKCGGCYEEDCHV